MLFVFFCAVLCLSRLNRCQCQRRSQTHQCHYIRRLSFSISWNKTFQPFHWAWPHVDFRAPPLETFFFPFPPSPMKSLIFFWLFIRYASEKFSPSHSLAWDSTFCALRKANTRKKKGKQAEGKEKQWKSFFFPSRTHFFTLIPLPFRKTTICNAELTQARAESLSMAVGAADKSSAEVHSRVKQLNSSPTPPHNDFSLFLSSPPLQICALWILQLFRVCIPWHRR